MNKFKITVGFLLICLSLPAQELQHESVVVNIEIPVRVFKGDQFIDNLTIDDFEVYEDGVLQNVEALYLIRKTTIKREEAGLEKEAARQKYAPRVSRHFVLVFEVQDYFPRFETILNEFFSNVIEPGDSLIVMTPLKTYNMNSYALEKMGSDTVVRQLKSILRKDIVLGNYESNNLIKEIIKVLVDDNDSNLNFAFASQYLENLYAQWRNLKKIQKSNLLDFSEYLKDLNGQKHVFLFYQKETLPQFSDKVMENLSVDGNHPHYYTKMYDLFFLSRRELHFELDEIKERFSDSSISSHFLYLTKTRSYIIDADIRKPINGLIKMEEKSWGIFSALKEVAEATGGIIESSANPVYMFERAVKTSENYYLLYYTPKNYTINGKFRNIKVEVKNGKYRILHRAGYLAD